MRFFKIALAAIYCFLPLYLHPAPTANSFERTGVLIHGCHLQAKEWDAIMFGKNALTGRVQVGIEEAIQKNAQLIYFGSGSSQTASGVKEAEQIYTLTLEAYLPNIAKYVHEDPQDLADYLRQVSVINITAQNTVEELQAAVALCQTMGITQLILVSSPTHIARCLQEACVLKAENPSLKLNFYARASDTCFANSTPRDVAIIEPPHRGDRPSIDFSKAVRKIIPFMKNAEIANEFYLDFMQLIEGYQHRLQN